MQKWKRCAALLCAALLCVVLLPVAALADGDVQIDATNFPDEVFRAYVARFDGDNDGALSAAEITAVKDIDVHSQGIQSLTGIEHFTALETLYCYSNDLTALDVSKNTALETLYCQFNNLTALDVSKNTALENLNCQLNKLTELDVTKNASLKMLWCSYNALTSLDVTQNALLTELNCEYSTLTELDVSRNTALKSLTCSGNSQLTTLDVSKNTQLTGLWCSNSQLTTLDVSKNTQLKTLSCYGSRLTSLDLSNNTQLTTLYSSSQKAAEMHVQRQADGSGRADLSALVPGWSRAQGVQVQGATLEADGSTVVWDGKSSPVTVTYTYQTGYQDVTLDATLNLLFDSGSLPVFTQPAGAQTVTVLEGETGVLSTAATDALVYQWYVNRNDGAGYVAVSGATGATYTTSAATVENDGYTYYCEASNAFGAARSPVFTLRVKAEPASGTDDDSNPEPTPGTDGDSNLEPTPGTDGDGNPEPVPETGDGSRPALWLSLLLLSGAVLAAAESGRRRCSR